MKSGPSTSDPLWYKDAVIYELPVKSFHDGNGDGIGDFAGLIQKLDYLQELGVTCLWLLPFFPSPMRDDGYDISDYRSIDPRYGTMDEFKSFLDAAHERGMQVMIELVINHTSDQHPWFQAARHAQVGSPERDFYVWSDSDQKFRGARIIFTDTESSNWTWDSIAKAYYWHRFFSHQPDLNYDNSAVLDEVIGIMRFWLDMGVDALRLDAIPYLVEREDTTCENLAETHAIIRQIRSAMDSHYQNRMILAEANQWPSDVLPYFGQGDECHMAFHFPLMPRLFMGLRLEDRHPITEIMGQTPSIPESCQWGLFLRNHDELTLEMVSDDERDYMYLAYSADPRMRVNVGIRRRLAPLVENNRLRIELLNSVLFSFPGTPILYYGDEIGMGDNIYLGDRNGVRTPMQWSADRNAGFSRATPARLYSPVIMDPVYGYESINVEAQQSDPSSLLSWMRNMIALRKLFRVFGRGSMEFLHPANRKVLAYVRSYENERILCVANLSRFAQPIELDLSRFEGLVPIEMLGYVEFPQIRKTPYPLTLGPYGHLWFELQPAFVPSVLGVVTETEEDLRFAFTNWKDIMTGPERAEFDRKIPAFLMRQRWFGGKARTIDTASVRTWAALPDCDGVLLLVDVRYGDGASDIYSLPLVWLDSDRVQTLSGKHPEVVFAPCRNGQGAICDATFDDGFCQWLLGSIEREERVDFSAGFLRATAGRFYQDLRGDKTVVLAAQRSGGEQSNTSIRYGGNLILKLFRHIEVGANPDCEVTQYLGEQRGLKNIPKFGGMLSFQSDSGEVATLGMLQELIDNQGDGWAWTLEELARYYETCAASQVTPDLLGTSQRSIMALADHGLPAQAADAIGIYLDASAHLARRTAEMHVALAADTDDEAFRPQALSTKDLELLSLRLRERVGEVIQQLKSGLGRLPDEIVDLAGAVLGQRRSLLTHFHGLENLQPKLIKTRVHGDFHLGQVLRVKNDFVLLDFEGEPARPLSERRAMHSPLKDVAGMLRSFSYAAQAAFTAHAARRPQSAASLEPWAVLWERCVSAVFVNAYRAATHGARILPEDSATLARLLDAFVMDKALYELSYELGNRPTWVRIPLLGILSLTQNWRVESQRVSGERSDGHG
jgi:maltose alpha-D-glucosyltransferase/alpha-amylase